jgi:hypothetical protein
MNQQFGESYAQSVAKDYVMAELDGRTIEQALADGEPAKKVWQAVVDTFDVPSRLQ